MSRTPKSPFVGWLKQLRRDIIGKVRYWAIKAKFLDIKAGKGFFSRPYFYLGRGYKVRIGDNTFIGRHAHLGSNLQIGNDVMIASYVSFVGGDHRFDDIGDVGIKYSGRESQKTTVIEDNVWIGHGTIIMAGLTIKTGAVVAAGAVLTKDVGQDEIWAGVPAKFVRKRRV